jgi:hypothetical protein
MKFRFVKHNYERCHSEDGFGSRASGLRAPRARQEMTRVPGRLSRPADSTLIAWRNVLNATVIIPKLAPKLGSNVLGAGEREWRGCVYQEIEKYLIPRTLSPPYTDGRSPRTAR